jgi:DNA polymerase III sliding clamp (beta) subunit (PCNA family)
MRDYFVTFGTDHETEVSGKQFGFSNPGRVQASDYSEATAIVQAAFGRKYCTIYADKLPNGFPECDVSDVPDVREEQPRENPQECYIPPNIIRALLPFTKNKDHLRGLNCVSVKPLGETLLEVVATDGHSLISVRVNNSGHENGQHTLTGPITLEAAKFEPLIKKSMTKSNTPIGVSVSRKSVNIQWDIEIYSPESGQRVEYANAEGFNYPDYEQVMSSARKEIEKINETMPIGINSEYLHRFGKAYKELGGKNANVCLQMGTPTTAIVVTPADGTEKFWGLIMPVRMAE